MEELLEKIKSLKKELASKDADIIKAASIGKELLEERSQLKINVEALKQEKHSLRMTLDSQTKTSESQLLEIESYKESCESLTKRVTKLEGENAVLNRKLQESVAENKDLKSALDKVTKKNNLLGEQVSLLQRDLDDCRTSLQMQQQNETNTEEHLKLVTDFNECEKEKNSLILLTSQLQEDLRETKLNEGKLADLIEGLRQELQERDQEIQSYSAIIEKSKEENLELQAQIEMLKYEQVDVNRRGNSLFGEVEDRRKLMEKQYIKIRGRHETLLKNYELRQQEIKKLKQHMTYVLSMFSSKNDSKYLQEMENRLSSTQREVDYLTICLKEQSENSRKFFADTVSSYTSTSEEYNYLRALLQQSQNKEKELAKELEHVRMMYVIESSKLTETQHELYHCERNLQNTKGEVMKLKLKLEDFTQDAPDEPKKGPVVEKIPGFKGPDQKENMLPENEDNLLYPLDRSADNNNIRGIYDPLTAVHFPNTVVHLPNTAQEGLRKNVLKDEKSISHQTKRKPSKRIHPTNVNAAVTAGSCIQQ